MKRSELWCALTLTAKAVHGYLDTSPFFMFSTSELLSSNSQLQLGSAVTAEIAKSLSQCPSELYIVVNQPGVLNSDYLNSLKHSPSTASRLMSPTSHSIRSTVSIPEVAGPIDISEWQEVLQSKCGVHHEAVDASAGSIPASFAPLPRAITLNLPPIKPEDRVQSLVQNDALLGSMLDMLPTSSYTVLYTTTRNITPSQKATEDAKEYDMYSEIQETLHLDLRRDMGMHQDAERANVTLPEGALFHRYQFLTPGIFMGFIVGILLLLILYVGVSALASLQVTYAAFDKESGQLAAKKSQ